jgi:hypothetical protein
MGHPDPAGQGATARSHAPPPEVVLRNRDVDWDRWPVQDYLSENYRQLHPADLAVIEHHSRFFRQFGPDSVDLSLEFGAGPNLYPLMLAAAVSRHIHAVEPSAASVAYLTRQLTDGPDASWAEFYRECRRQLPALPGSLVEALSRVEVTRGRADSIEPGRYGLASMNFVAESVTEDADEFSELCGRFIAAVRPGGHLVAAFMENMARYELGDGSSWPGYPVDDPRVRAAFAGRTEELVITRTGADPTLPAYGYTGMVMLTARRPP